VQNLKVKWAVMVQYKDKMTSW